MQELNTSNEGFMWFKDPEGAQRPRALYHINPGFHTYIIHNNLCMV